VDQKYKVGSGSCPFCGKDNQFEVNKRTLDAIKKWLDGSQNIQNAVPMLSASKREVLISGICIPCQSSVFDEPEPLPPLEEELKGMGYVHYATENEVEGYIDNETKMILTFDNNIMTVVKVIKDDWSSNGNLEELTSQEIQLAHRHGFSTEPDEDDGLPF